MARGRYKKLHHTDDKWRHCCESLQRMSASKLRDKLGVGLAKKNTRTQSLAALTPASTGGAPEAPVANDPNLARNITTMPTIAPRTRRARGVKSHQTWSIIASLASAATWGSLDTSPPLLHPGTRKNSSGTATRRPLRPLPPPPAESLPVPAVTPFRGETCLEGVKLRRWFSTDGMRAPDRYIYIHIISC